MKTISQSSKAVPLLRRQFPQLRGKQYFNCGAVAIMPRSVVQACHEGVKIASTISVNPDVLDKWLSIVDETRLMSANLIGAKPEQVAFVSSTSSALSLISQSLSWEKGDNIITAAVENPATVVPWQNLKRFGVEIRYLPSDKDHLIDIDSLPGLVDNRTRLVALSLVQYGTGQRLNLRKVVNFCKPRGILVSVDGVQAVGAIPVNVAELGVNFLSFGALKWLLGPRHIGVIYVDRTALSLTHPPVVSENTVFDIKAEEEQPGYGPPELFIHKDARKFESLPYYNFAGMLGLHQALKNFFLQGPESIHRRIYENSTELIEGLLRFGGRVVSPRTGNEWSGIVSYAPEGISAENLVARLRERQVYVALRKGRVRFCPHYYHESTDLKNLLEAVKDCLPTFYDRKKTGSSILGKRSRDDTFNLGLCLERKVR